MRALLGLAGVTAVFVMLAPSAAGQSGSRHGGDDDFGNPVIGRAIFVRDNCYSCHGTFGGGGDGPNLREDPPDQDDVEEAVLEGMPTGMPSFARLLDRNEVADLAAYIQTLGSIEEPVSTHWWEFIPSHFPDESRCCAPPNEPPHTTP
jgi:mono/diheme cytochrome c family protein